MKKILIAGGAGFIGSHLCEWLLNEGNEVWVIDNLLTGKKSNIDNFEKNAGFHFVEADICEPLPEEVMGLNFDYIYNLACPASPIHYQNHPLETLWVSSVGVRNLLELAEKCGARFLHTSTSEVYGDPLEHPQKEKYWGNVNCTGPRSCYDEGKRFAESLILNFAKEREVEVRIVRIFNTYGPRMCRQDGRAVPCFIDRALANEELSVHGDGKQTRSFCYISDMIDGIVSLMLKDDFVGPVNIGNPDERTILELAEKIIELSGSDSQLKNVEASTDDPKTRRPDISLAEAELGFSPKVGLDEGLKKTIEWFRLNE